MLGTALNRARNECGLTQELIGMWVNVSASLIKEWEKGRRWITDELKPILARKLDSGRFYMALKCFVTGGVSAPYLNGRKVEDHRLACTLKLKEELTEALKATDSIIEILIIPPKAITESQRKQIENWMLESIEAHTAAENTLVRIAKEYSIPLGELYDRHQQELIEKEFLEKEKPSKAA